MSAGGRGSPKIKRIRADQALVAAGLAESRSRAQALILAGLAYAGDRRIAKAGDNLDPAAALRLKGKDHPWVSRGGLKLEKGLTHFGFDPNGVIALDIGASTGGFTDVLLTRGAARVYAVDVGKAQLAWKLRADPRIVVLEGVNARALDQTQIPEPVGAIVCDASFIGLSKVLTRPLHFAAPGAWLLGLVKPQFEVGPDKVGAGGVVRDSALHKAVCAEAQDWIAAQPGWRALGLVESPITGAKGNIEFLLGARRN